MKVGCKICGVHFKDEFAKTLLPPCNFWGDKGVGNLPDAYKQKLWSWMFDFPADEIFCAMGEKLTLAMDWQAAPVQLGTKFNEIVSNWDALTDEQRKEFERNWIKERVSGQPMPQLPIYYGPRKEN